MMRRIAVVGDKLSNDGEICSYQGPQFLVHGHQAALIGGAAYCPVCKTTGYIAKDGGPRRMNLFVSEIAVHDDVVVCGCPEHPRIFAELAGEAWYDDMAETLRNTGPRKTEGGGAPLGLARQLQITCRSTSKYVQTHRLFVSTAIRTSSKWRMVACSLVA